MSEEARVALAGDGAQTDAGGAAPPPAFLLRLLKGRRQQNDYQESVPPELEAQLLELEQWADANQRDRKLDSVAFWSLKLPAVLASTRAGQLAHFQLTTIGVMAGAIASLCVLIDGVFPRGLLRNSHLRAYHDIRILSTNMMVQWRSRETGNDSEIARRIIRDAEPERQRIANYIRDAETSLKAKD